ncbi:hypothetical protein [Streptomyces sp. sk226]|uniref:hypothetical protein n=1 Tax=Streptomyces sp. sk226 TaxID=2034268 RepID=UPI000BEFEFA6|nr:hypothetical protein [Streptomyces sp. sk226]
MAHWNLDVSLRGQGTSLARTLRANAGHARTLARATSDAEREVRRLGTTSRTAQGAIAGVGRASDAARGRLQRMARQAQNGARDLRGLARAAADAERNLNRAVRDIRITARLDDNTTAARASLRTALAEIQALSPVRIRVDFDGDPARLAATAAAVRDLRTNAGRAEGSLSALATRGAAAAVALRAAEEAAADLSRELRTLRGRAVAAAAALDEIGDRARHAATGIRSVGSSARTAHTNLGDLSGSTRTLRGDLDDLDGTLTRVTRRLGGLNGSLGTVGNTTNSSGSGMRNLIVAAAALGTALIPIAAATAPIAAGLTASGVAIGAFGVAVAGQIMALTEAAEAEKKYQDAVDEHGKSSEEAAKAEAEYLRTLSDMPPAARESAAALAVFKDEYKDYSDALASDTMPVVTKSLGLFGALLPHTQGLVKGTSRELDRLLNVAAGGMTTPGFDRFIKSFTEFATGALARGTTHLTGFIRALDTGEVGSDLREFMAYARENGPLVGETLRNLAKAVTNLLVAASDMGVSVLTAVNALAQLVNAVPPEALSTFIQLYAAMKLATLGMAAMGAVAGGAALANVTAFGRSMMFGGVRQAIGGVTQRMSGLQKAAIGLGVLGVVAIGVAKLAENARGAPPDVDRLTTSLKRLHATGEYTGELKDTFGDTAGLVKKIDDIGKAAKESEEYVKSFGNAGIGPLDDLRRGAHNLWQDFTEGEKSLSALKDDFKGLDESLASMTQSGNGKQAGEFFDLVEASAKNAGKSAKEVAELFPEYKAAVAAAAAEQELAAQGMGLFGRQAQATKEKLDAQKASTDGLRQSIVALNETNRAALGGMIGFEASIDAAAKAAKENAGSLKMVNGELDLNSPKAQAAATALQDLAAKTDEAATAAKDQNRSWEYVNGIYERGEQAIIRAGQAMGLTNSQARSLAASILVIPEKKVSTIEMRREDAIAGLDSVIAKIKATPGNKSVTVKALTADAKALLEQLGYKTKTLPDGRVQVTALTGSAISGLQQVKYARDSLSDKTITITTNYRVTGSTARREGAHGAQLREADGGVVDYYADGGIRGGIRSFAQGGFGSSPDTKNGHVAHIARAGTWRVFAEDETGGESYVPLHPSKRTRSRAITEETVRRLGGDPDTIQWNANGSVTSFASGGFTYSPDGLRRDTGYVQSSYSSSHQPIDRDAYLKATRARKNAVDSLRTAEAKLAQVRKSKGTRAQIVAAEARVAKARRSVATATDAARKAEARYKQAFSLGDWQKTLRTAVSANASYEASLAKISARGGADIVDQLRDLGEEGAKVVAALAKASNKQFNDIVANLRKLGPLAKATLADYTKQLTASNKTSATFQANLVKLAGMGYGDLATQLAGQGDEAAQKLAAEAVRNKGAAAKANSAAKTQSKQLSDDEVAQLLAIIAAVKTSKTGLHTVADTTGLGEDEVITVANKATTQIKSSLGPRSTQFLADLARANRGLSYANGGIREGIYATRGGAVTFAEPSTGGEAYIPLGASKRGPATNVLRDVAARFGVGLTDVSGNRPLVIVREGGDTNVTVSTVRTGATASDIASQVGRQVRRARRGGVNARAAA